MDDDLTILDRRVRYLEAVNEEMKEEILTLRQELVRLSESINEERNHQMALYGTNNEFRF